MSSAPPPSQPAHASLARFHPAVQSWFTAAFEAPTRTQDMGWPAIAGGGSTLLLAPTGTGKTLTAFLWCVNRLMFEATAERKPRCRVVYVSPLKALAIDVERNLQSPLVGIARVASARGDSFHMPSVAMRTGDTPQIERARFQRNPTDILITTPESLYLLLTSQARKALSDVETIIIDEIHALVPEKRGAHLALSLERLEVLTGKPLQRIGLSATAHPVQEVARFLGGAQNASGTPQLTAAAPPQPTAATPARPPAPTKSPRRKAHPTAPRTRKAARPRGAAESVSRGAAESGLRGAAELASRGPADLASRVSAESPRGAVEPPRGAPALDGCVDGAPLVAAEPQAAELGAAIDEFAEPGVVARVVSYRPVQIVDATAEKALRVSIEVPVEDMRRLGEIEDLPSGPAAQGPVRTSIWQAIHPRLLELIQAHTSTLIFVNARRAAERLSGALNDLAGETVAYAHHGSLSREQRADIEDRLKAGRVRALVATSSLELGIDMGAIDLVVQIEAPPSVASGLQRIGRAGHSVGLESAGVIFPKYRGDLLACAALSSAMLNGRVEAARYPRNALDVLAQQIVAILSLDAMRIDDLFALVQRAAAYAELPRHLFESVLDMLAGRYASDEFAELKPRITWDRVSGMLTARQGAQRVAIANAGTIPDRGLYGVFLASVERRGARLGELDEEMVFESKPGETFVLGASTWRIEEITHDKVLVSPAPGEPGKLPFWRGEAKGRSIELGRSIGALSRELTGLPDDRAQADLINGHGLAPGAARNLLQYLSDQLAATRAVPDDRTLVIERCRDELGDFRVCVLSPWGGRVHAPWAMAAVARIRRERGIEVESLWTDDGFVVRFPDNDDPPDPELLLPQVEELDGLLLHALGSSALFAARFRENAARALLLPRRRPGQRTPLWQQRKRSADLLAVASQYPSFPMLLETYRECLRDVFDLPALTRLLSDVSARNVRVVTVDTDVPSPFASALLFGFVANYIYEGDAPLAERRAQALRIDQAQLRELLGEAELRELLDPAALAQLEAQLQLLDPRYRIEHADSLNDALLRIGDLTLPEIAQRCGSELQATEWIKSLSQARRVIGVKWGTQTQTRYIAVEDAARYRDALGVVLPPGLPQALLAPVRDAMRDLVLRFARTHAPFTLAELCQRFGLGQTVARDQLLRLESDGKVVEGAFRPGGTERDYAHAEVLRSLRQRSLAKLRKEIEPVDTAVLGRFTVEWHGIVRPRAGLDAVLDAVERLQGLALPISVIEREILSARVFNYRADDLDALAAAGEIVWSGVEPLGERDGRIALYLTDHFPRLWTPPNVELDEREERIVQLLAARGASFFAAIQAELGGYPQTTLDALYGLVWKGLVTNDTFRALRAYAQPRSSKSARSAGMRRSGLRGFRSRRETPRSAEGRWSLLASLVHSESSATERANAWSQVLLQRYGVVTREVAQAERISGGFSALYDVFKALEDAGRIRRGYFVQGVSAMQFALPGVLEQLRALRDPPASPRVVALAATDPANPYGALIKWPKPSEGSMLARAAQAVVLLVDGALTAYLSRSGKQLQVFPPEAEPDRSRALRAVAERLRDIGSLPDRSGLMLGEIDGAPAHEHPIAPFLQEAGFHHSQQGYYLPRSARTQVVPLDAAREPEPAELEDEDDEADNA